MTTIPASELVASTPSVLGVGGSALEVLGILLTTNTRVPIGTVPRFPDAASVSDYFGASSDEAALASIYFNGFTISNKKPAGIYFAQYNQDSVAAYLRGGDVSALTLSELQALSGTLTIVVDGVTIPAGTVNLSAATSFSSAATIIETALDAGTPQAAEVTGSIGGSVTASMGASFTGSGSGTNLTVTAVTGVIHPGDVVAGTGVTAGTTIISQTSGTPGGAGVYVTSAATTSSGASLTTTSEILDVTAVGSGSVHANDVLSGSGVTAGTIVLDQLSGPVGGVGTYLIDRFQAFVSTTVAALSTVLKVTAVASGALEVNSVIAGTNITVGTTITAILTGSGGVGTYRVSAAATTVSETITSDAVAPTVTYDSVSGAFLVTSGTDGVASTIAFATGSLAAGIKLTSATGATLSQGAAAAVPATFMNALVSVTTNWATFMTTFDPDDGSGNSVKEAFAAWKNTQNNRYGYVCWDPDLSPSTSLPANSSLGQILLANEDSGTCLIGQDAVGATSASLVDIAAFICGSAASIDFTETAGRITFAYKEQDGLVATVSNATAAQNLGGNPQTANRGNGYNFYGAYADIATFSGFQRGFVTGPFAFFDSYINQIWLNSQLRAAGINLERNSKSIPYTIAGDTLIEQALQDPIDAGLNFGAFGAGDISNSQAAAVNAAANANVSGVLQTQGYYLQVLPASSPSRAARTTPPCTLWYLDRGSVQALNIASVALQ